jgi:plasmid stability protein
MAQWFQNGTIVEVDVTTITVKNIPENLYEQLKVSAKNNRRSINSEIIICIERSVMSRRFEPEIMIAKARQLRELTAGYVITDEAFNQAKSEGRP